MAFEQKPAILVSDPKGSSFDTVLDRVCERLQEKQIQNSIQRIREMELTLDRLERELEEFMGHCTGQDR